MKNKIKVINRKYLKCIVIYDYTDDHIVIYYDDNPLFIRWRKINSSMVRNFSSVFDNIHHFTI